MRLKLTLKKDLNVRDDSVLNAKCDSFVSSHFKAFARVPFYNLTGLPVVKQNA